jgi:5'-methylthioadenosine phosphorylase
MPSLTSVPEVAFANIGGSGSWGYRFPEGVFESTSPLQVRRIDSGLVFDTPYGASPPFGLYELVDGARGSRRQFFRVWMHGLTPGEVQAGVEDPYAHTSMRASEKVFWVLREAKTRWILVDASVGGINRLLDTWDLVIPHDFFDDMKRVPRLDEGAFLRLRHPFCAHLRKLLFEAAVRAAPRLSALAQQLEDRVVYPNIIQRGVYVCPDGPWFESTAQISDYQLRGFDIVGKTLVPEVQLARAISAHFASLNPVVNPAEGLVDPDSGAMFAWRRSDLLRIYRSYGPIISAAILETIAAIDPERSGCSCQEYIGGHTFAEFSQFMER